MERGRGMKIDNAGQEHDRIDLGVKLCSCGESMYLPQQIAYLVGCGIDICRDADEEQNPLFYPSQRFFVLNLSR